MTNVDYDPRLFRNRCHMYPAVKHQETRKLLSCKPVKKLSRLWFG